MEARLVLTAVVTLLVLQSGYGSSVTDDSKSVENSPLRHIFSTADLAEYRKRCQTIKEEEQKKNPDLWELKNKGNAEGCSEIENLVAVLAVSKEGLLPAAEDTDKLSSGAHLENEDNTLMMTRKAAVLSGARAKRSTYVWTCSQIQSIPMLFLTATTEEIDAMDNNEFTECIPDIGQLTDLKSDQREALLSKAKTALSKSNVCEMETTDLVNLGVVALAFEESDLNCLPLSDTSLVTSLGSLEEWTAAELSALAARYISTKSLSDLSTLTSEDITMLGSILCGFTADQLATIPSAVIGKSGANIGGLHECSVAQLTELVTLATQEDAYGAVSTLDAAEISELGYLIAGLSGTEIKELTVAALEGLAAEVIPVIPAAVLKEMTTAQFESFTDAQAVSVTDEQKEVMSDEQKTVLGGQATGGEKVLEEVVIIEESDDDSTDDSTDDGSGGDGSGGDGGTGSGSYIRMSLSSIGIVIILLLLG